MIGGSEKMKGLIIVPEKKELFVRPYFPPKFHGVEGDEGKKKLKLKLKKKGPKIVNKERRKMNIKILSDEELE